DLDQLGHPHAADHHRLDPFDRDNARPRTSGRTARRDLGCPRLETPDELAAFSRAPERVGDARDVGPDIAEAGRVQVDDTNAAVDELGRRGADVIERDRADVTEILGDDDVGPRRLQLRELDLVDGKRVLQHTAHLAIDLTAGPDGVHAGAGQRRQASHRFGEITLVGDSDEVGLGAYGADDLRGGWEQRGDTIA